MQNPLRPRPIRLNAVVGGMLLVLLVIQQGPSNGLQQHRPRHHLDEQQRLMQSRQAFLCQSASSMLAAATLLAATSFPAAAAAAATDTATSSSASSPSQQRPPEQFATSAGRKNCRTTSDPAKTIVTCRGGLLPVNATTTDTRQLRLSGVSATENGVSTSAIKTPSRYAPPWTYLVETSDASVAWKSLQHVIQEVDNGAMTIQQATDTYVHATAPTLAAPPGIDSVDDVEFLLRPDDCVVLVRSVSRTSVFVYPLTQPVSDSNSNRQRLERIRAKLGWDVLQ